MKDDPQRSTPGASGDGPKRERQEPNPWSLAGAGMELAAATTGLLLAGWWLDGKFGTGPWLMLTGMSMGVIGGTFNLWKLGKRFFE